MLFTVLNVLNGGRERGGEMRMGKCQGNHHECKDEQQGRKEVGRRRRRILPNPCSFFLKEDGLGLPKLGQHRVYVLKGLVDLFAQLCACQDDLTRDKDQQDNLGLDHAINEPWKKLWLIRGVMAVRKGKALQPNGKLDVAAPNDILDLKVGEAGRKAELLDDAGILTSRQSRKLFALGACDDHLARGKDQGRGLWIADAHNDGRKSLQRNGTISRPTTTRANGVP